MNPHREFFVTLRLSTALLLFLSLAMTPSASAHQGHSERGAWDACEDRTLGDVCEWGDAKHSRYIGTCRAVSGDLLCVRNKPIQPPPKTDAPPHADAEASRFWGGLWRLNEGRAM